MHRLEHRREAGAPDFVFVLGASPKPPASTPPRSVSKSPNRFEATIHIKIARASERGHNRRIAVLPLRLDIGILRRSSSNTSSHRT